MSLTRRQRAKIRDLEEIAEIVGVDFWNAHEEPDSDRRNIVLDLAKNRLVRTDIVFTYVLMDELLTDVMCQQLFDPKKTSMELWRTKRFRNFNYYVVEELSLLRKLAFVKASKAIPKAVEETIRLTNVLRNAVAHSFFPMNKRDFKRTRKVTYKGKDVFTLEGLKLFSAEADEAIDSLSILAFGKRQTRKW